MMSAHLPPTFLASNAVYPFKRRELIPLKSHCTWRIEYGFARTVTWDQEGTPMTLGFWQPGDVISPSLVMSQPYQVECLTSVELKRLSHWHYSQAELLAYLQQREELIKIIHCKGMGVRLLNFLNWSSQRFGYAVPQGRLIALQLTHQDTADVLGTTRVTITRLMNRLEQEGRISWSQRHCIVHQG